jgi:phosphate transport system permease protein
MILGFGRAVGEGIAVALVIGSASPTVLSSNLFNPGNTMAAWIVQQYAGLPSPLATSSLIFLGLILLVFSIFVNLFAQYVVRTVARRQGLVSR